MFYGTEIRTGSLVIERDGRHVGKVRHIAGLQTDVGHGRTCEVVTVVWNDTGWVSELPVEDLERYHG